MTSETLSQKSHMHVLPLEGRQSSLIPRDTMNNITHTKHGVHVFGRMV